MRKKEKYQYKWIIKKEGHQFFCRYDGKEDFVYVNCEYFYPGDRSAKAGNSGYELIATLLASEIIKDDKKF